MAEMILIYMTKFNAAHRYRVGYVRHNIHLIAAWQGNHVF